MKSYCSCPNVSTLQSSAFIIESQWPWSIKTIIISILSIDDVIIGPSGYKFGSYPHNDHTRLECWNVGSWTVTFQATFKLAFKFKLELRQTMSDLPHGHVGEFICLRWWKSERFSIQFTTTNKANSFGFSLSFSSRIKYTIITTCTINGKIQVHGNQVKDQT